MSFGEVDYEDSFCLIINDQKILDLDYLIYKLIEITPNWLKILVNFRNKIVFIFGLKTGNIGDYFYNREKLNVSQGQTIGDFFILLKNKNHLIIELKDKHLNFRFSIMIIEKDEQISIIFTTIVKINNYFGRIYFLFIKPFHRLIVPNLLKKISNEVQNSFSK